MVAVATGNLKAVQFAIEYNKTVVSTFNFNFQGGENQQTLMHVAISRANLQMIFTLL